MKYKGSILLDDPRAERLGVTRQSFQDFFAWDCRPHYIGIIRLKPRDKKSLEEFMDCGQKIFSEIRICAPDKDIIEIAKNYGYELRKDSAGTPYLTDELFKLNKRN